MLKLSPLILEADPQSNEDNISASPEIVYPLYIKVRNQVGWNDKKLTELREKYGFDKDYYDSIRTWIFSIHQDYLDQMYQDLLKINGGEIEEIKSLSNIDKQVVADLYYDVLDKFKIGSEGSGRLVDITKKYGWRWSVESKSFKDFILQDLNQQQLNNLFKDLVELSRSSIKENKMIKLTNVLSEIKNSSKITPELIYQSITIDNNIFGTRRKIKNDKVLQLLDKFGYNETNWIRLFKDKSELTALMFLKHLEKEGRLGDFWNEYRNISEIQSVPELTSEIVKQLFWEKWKKNSSKEYRRRIMYSLTKIKDAENFKGGVNEFIDTFDKEQLKGFYKDLKQLNEIKNLVPGNIDRKKVYELYSNLYDHSYILRNKAIDILYKYGYIRDKNIESFFSNLDKIKLMNLYYDLKKINDNYKNGLDEAPQDYQNYLDNPNFQKDYSSEQQIQQITATIKDRIAKKKWQEYSDGSYTMKIGDLYVKYFPEGSSGLKRAELMLGYKPEAGYSPESKILYLYGKVDDNEIRHELTHYIDAKVIGGKQVAAQSKERNAKLANTQGRERYELYYNTPEEFNAHWFEYIMPVVNQLFDDGNIPSLDQFTQFVKTNKDVDNFYDHLNDDNKNRFNKRLGVYYQAMQQGRPEVDNGKIETPGFISKLKSLFQKRAA